MSWDTHFNDPVYSVQFSGDYVGLSNEISRVSNIFKYEGNRSSPSPIESGRNDRNS